MTTEKNETMNKNQKDQKTQEQRVERNRFGDRIENIDAIRHPEEQVVNPNLYGQKNKTDLNGPPSNQKV
jgi:hypothetical protein